MERRLPAALDRPRAIERFAGENRFLSNFFLKPLTWNGERWPSAEHAYQAAKCRKPEHFQKIRNAPSPGAAKRWSRKVEMRVDWDRVKEDVMLSVVRAKFADPWLRRRLLATGDARAPLAASPMARRRRRGAGGGKRVGRPILGSVPWSG